MSVGVFYSICRLHSHNHVYQFFCHCWTVGLSVGLLDCRTASDAVGRAVGLSDRLSDCRTRSRQWQTVREHVTMELLSEFTVGMTVGLSDCRTRDCRNTVGYCRTNLSDCRTGAQSSVRGVRWTELGGRGSCGCHAERPRTAGEQPRARAQHGHRGANGGAVRHRRAYAQSYSRGEERTQLTSVPEWYNPP